MNTDFAELSIVIKQIRSILTLFPVEMLLTDKLLILLILAIANSSRAETPFGHYRLAELAVFVVM